MCLYKEGVDKEMMEKVVKKGSYWYYVILSLKKQMAALFGLGIVIFIMLLAIFAPWISPHDPTIQHWGKEYAPPSAQFLLGTDGLGRDVLSRLIWGARTSMFVGFLSTFLVTAIATVLGSLAGYYRGRLEQIIMRFTDIFMTIPSLVFFIFVTAIFKRATIPLIILTIALLRWPGLTRIVRSCFLSFRETAFVEAARGLGSSDRRIIFLHILPNALSPIIVSATMRIPSAIMLEATLSFLALGDPTVISWGGILNRGHEVMRAAPWIATFPGIMILLTVIGFNLFGDGLRDALDVRLREL